MWYSPNGYFTRSSWDANALMCCTLKSTLSNTFELSSIACVLCMYFAWNHLRVNTTGWTSAIMNQPLSRAYGNGFNFLKGSQYGELCGQYIIVSTTANKGMESKHKLICQTWQTIHGEPNELPCQPWTWSQLISHSKPLFDQPGTSH